MSSEQTQDPVAAQLRTMRIIWGALIAGVLVFLGIMMFLRSGGDEPMFAARDLMDPSAILSIVGILFAAGAVLGFAVVPSLAVSGGRREVARGGADRVAGSVDAPKPELPGLAALYQTKQIIGLALLEGAAFFNGIAFMVEGGGLNLGIALGLVALMAAQFPTRRGMQDWIEHQQRRLRDELDRPH